MTDTGTDGGATREAAFAALMVVVSVLIFLVVRRSERAKSGSHG